MRAALISASLILLSSLTFAEEAELTWLNCCCPLTIIILPLLAIVLLSD